MITRIIIKKNNIIKTKFKAGNKNNKIILNIRENNYLIIII